MQTEEKVQKIIEESLSGLGYEIVKVKYLNRGRTNILQIMIERTDDTPITVNDCEKASHTISALLDVEDPISAAYSLEVSSPGIDRPLVKLKDYIKYKGYEISIRLFMPINNVKSFHGTLEEVIDNDIVINTGTIKHQINVGNIDSAKLVLNDKLLKEFEQISN